MSLCEGAKRNPRSCPGGTRWCDVACLDGSCLVLEQMSAAVPSDCGLLLKKHDKQAATRIHVQTLQAGALACGRELEQRVGRPALSVVSLAGAA